ncbi:hypothetical protein [Streptomyces sp. PSAA01]|nr:hypothetical protein [Streptomyces sp. PSAA01]
MRRDVPSFGRGAVVAGRAHAAEPHMDTAPRPLVVLLNRGLHQIR